MGQHSLLPLPQDTKDWRWQHHAFMWGIVTPATIISIPFLILIDFIKHGLSEPKP